MSVTIYKALKHRILAEKKIYQSDSWVDIPSNAKMWLNGAWHKIGSGSQNQETIPIIPEIPEQSITHENGTEPNSGNIWYITPLGRGNKDGSSWNNAAAGSMIHVILLQCSSGDSVYFSEGDYTTEYTITLPAGVNLYGGFVEEVETWSTRNGFTHQTIFMGDNTFGWMNGSSATSGQIVDGFVIKNYNSTITGSNATLRNSIVSLGTAILPNAYNSVFISTAATVSNATQCNFFYGTSCSIGTSANHVNVYGTSEQNVQTYLNNAEYCTAIKSSYLSGRAIFCGTITNCIALDCNSLSNRSDYDIYIFDSGAINCIAFNSKFNFGGIFYQNATNCKAINCSCSELRPEYGTVFNLNATNCIAVNCHGHIGSNAKNCKAINCDHINTSGSSASIYNNATNCIAVNCTASYSGNVADSSAYIFFESKNCTAVNCYVYSKSNSYKCSIFYKSQSSINSLSWNNYGNEFYNYGNNGLGSCAGSVYNENLALTLGTDNSIARFTNTGYYPAQGVQDVGDCPNPITDPNGFSVYIESFGDWHPLSNSFLIGKGTTDSNITTDLDGVTRPSPPTIGAYEPKPIQQ